MIDKSVQDIMVADPFAQKLGAKIVKMSSGYAEISLEIDADMLNFHGMTHGGVVFSLGDIAFAVASNSYGQTALAMNVNVSFLKPSKAGDKLVATAEEVNAGGRTALYDIFVRNGKTGELISKSQGMVYRKNERFVE